jgi:nanoRNase/pAp phosphatase (c-di-AMP/oligoRNAs hydrolase)
MAFNDIEQLAKAIEESRHVLVLFSTINDGDAIASALALKLFIEKQHKQVDIAASGFMLPKNYRFLPAAETIRAELAHLQKFIIKVDVSRSPIETLSYDIKDNTLSIYLTPKHGLITKNELRTAQSTFKYDLVITLNTPDLESLGSIFYNNTDLFYRTSIVNIDRLPSNERYGQINVVDLTATSTSEIIYKTLKQIGEQYIDVNTATALLTGMTIATNSFKNPNITPLTLQIASQLVNTGADREKVVQNLYRTRTISTLKLWGQALTHLQHDAKLGLVWTTLTHEDFTRSGAAMEDLTGITEEIISNSPEARIIMVLYEADDIDGKKVIKGTVTTEKNNDAILLLKPLKPEGNKKQAIFTMVDKTLTQTEAIAIEVIKEHSK